MAKIDVMSGEKSRRSNHWTGGGDRGIRRLFSSSPSADKDNGSSIDQKYYTCPFKLKRRLFLCSSSKILYLLEILIFPFSLITRHDITTLVTVIQPFIVGREGDGREEFPDVLHCNTDYY